MISGSDNAYTIRKRTVIQVVHAWILALFKVVTKGEVL